MISYEEYYPYGRSAYRAAASGVDLSLKRYRFTGKERDEETGLDYFGVRYYASWLGRWTSSDPGGFVDGLNLYRYVRNNPINGIDREGYSTEEVEKPKPPPVDPPKEKKAKGYTHYGFLSPQKEGNISPQIYEETYEVHSAVFSEKLVNDLLSGKLQSKEDIKKEVLRIQAKNFKDADSERYATQHYNAPGIIDIDGDSQTVSKLSSNNRNFTVYGYYNASDSGSLWRYKIVGGSEENAPVMFYAWEVDESTKQPVVHDAEYYERLRAKLPTPYTEQTWEEGKVWMGKTTLVVVSVLTLGGGLSTTASANMNLLYMQVSGAATSAEVAAATNALYTSGFFTFNAAIGTLYSIESLSGGSGEGIIERNANKNDKIMFNVVKTTSAAIGGAKGLINLLSSPDPFMFIFNSVNTAKGIYGAKKSAKKVGEESKK